MYTKKNNGYNYGYSPLYQTTGLKNLNIIDESLFNPAYICSHYPFWLFQSLN